MRRHAAEEGRYVALVDRTAGHSVVGSIEELEALYDAPVTTSLLKELDHLHPLHVPYIEASPFVVLATVGPEGVDCSPRGDPAGFVRVLDPHTLALPDRRGNNRLDSLRNIVRDPRVALLFMVPGVGVTLRVNGTAVLSTDPQLRASFVIDGKEPATVIVVTVERAYTQCPKALVRSHLWDPHRHLNEGALPSMGQLLASITDGDYDAAAYDQAYPERIRQTIY